MHYRRLLVAASLCLAATVSQGGPLAVSFVPNNGETEQHGPKDQMGHYEFSWLGNALGKNPPPATPGGYGLTHFPAHAGSGLPPVHVPKDLSQQPGHGIGSDFEWPGQSNGQHGLHTGHVNLDMTVEADVSHVPEPGSLALLLLSLTGLTALGLRNKGRG